MFTNKIEKDRDLFRKSFYRKKTRDNFFNSGSKDIHPTRVKCLLSLSEDEVRKIRAESDEIFYKENKDKFSAEKVAIKSTENMVDTRYDVYRNYENDKGEIYNTNSYSNCTDPKFISDFNEQIKNLHVNSLIENFIFAFGNQQGFCNLCVNLFRYYFMKVYGIQFSQMDCAMRLKEVDENKIIIEEYGEVFRAEYCIMGLQKDRLVKGPVFIIVSQYQAEIKNSEIIFSVLSSRIYMTPHTPEVIKNSIFPKDPSFNKNATQAQLLEFLGKLTSLWLEDDIPEALFLAKVAILIKDIDKLPEGDVFQHSYYFYQLGLKFKEKDTYRVTKDEFKASLKLIKESEIMYTCNPFYIHDPLFKNFVSFNLKGCNVTNDDIKWVARKMPKLIELDLSDNVSINAISGNQGNNFFANTGLEFKKLEYLNLQGCTNLNHIDIDAPKLLKCNIKNCTNLDTVQFYLNLLINKLRKQTWIDAGIVCLHQILLDPELYENILSKHIPIILIQNEISNLENKSLELASDIQTKLNQHVELIESINKLDLDKNVRSKLIITADILLSDTDKISKKKKEIENQVERLKQDALVLDAKIVVSQSCIYSAEHTLKILEENGFGLGKKYSLPDGDNAEYIELNKQAIKTLKQGHELLNNDIELLHPDLWFVFMDLNYAGKQANRNSSGTRAELFMTTFIKNLSKQFPLHDLIFATYAEINNIAGLLENIVRSHNKPIPINNAKDQSYMQQCKKQPIEETLMHIQNYLGKLKEIPEKIHKLYTALYVAKGKHIINKTHVQDLLLCIKNARDQYVLFNESTYDPEVVLKVQRR